MSLTEAEDIEIPERGTADAAKWLIDRGLGHTNLGEVAKNGDTALFWCVAGLLANYLEEYRSQGVQERT
jgi:hypothetical protein